MPGPGGAGGELPPLILTLGFDEASFSTFDRLRRQHFPPERNLIPAHLTLFHHLPGERETEIAAHLADVCAAHPSFTLAVTGPRSLGRGVALVLESEPLVILRRALAERWREHVTPQDRQGFRPHVTIQNKVPPEKARRLLHEMGAAFVPFTAKATALLLWRYRGGPWESRGAFPFSGLGRGRE